jgi:hypothetical protein
LGLRKLKDEIDILRRLSLLVLALVRLSGGDGSLFVLLRVRLGVMAGSWKLTTAFPLPLSSFLAGSSSVPTLAELPTIDVDPVVVSWIELGSEASFPGPRSATAVAVLSDAGISAGK